MAKSLQRLSLKREFEVAIYGFSGVRASYTSVDRIYLYIILTYTDVNNGV